MRLDQAQYTNKACKALDWDKMRSTPTTSELSPHHDPRTPYLLRNHNSTAIVP